MNDHPVSDDELFAAAFDDPDLRSHPRIAAHIASCPSCATRLVQLELVRATLRADAALAPSAAAAARVRTLIVDRARPVLEPASVFASLRQVVASLVFDGRSSLALQGLRGATDAYLMSYGLDALDVDLEIAPSADGEDDRWQVTGQVSAADATGRLALAFAEPGRWEPFVELESDDDGMFFAELATGPYDLLIRISDTVVIVPNLEVG